MLPTRLALDGLIVVYWGRSPLLKRVGSEHLERIIIKRNIRSGPCPLLNISFQDLNNSSSQITQHKNFKMSCAFQKSNATPPKKTTQISNPYLCGNITHNMVPHTLFPRSHVMLPHRFGLEIWMVFLGGVELLFIVYRSPKPPCNFKF